jgi:alpha-1,3-mannosyltransferase
MQNVKSLKIIHVTRQFSPGVGGLENFVKDLARKQVDEGHDVRTVSLDRIFNSKIPAPLPTNDTHDGIKIRRIPFFGNKRYPIAPSVINHLDDADIVHVHAIDFFCDYLSFTRLLHRKNLVLTTHGGFFHTSFAQFFKKLYFETVTRLTLTGYRAVIACSAEDARIFRHVRKEGVVEIQNAVDISKFAGMSQRAGSTIIYFGRLAPNKGLITTLHWFSQFIAKNPGWSLIIAGQPMGVDIPTLQGEIDLLDIAKHVTIVEAPSDPELASLIARSKVFVSASTYEGFGLAAVEAASAGLYPVLSSIPPYHAIVERLGYGTLIDFTDPKCWAEGDERLVTDLKNFEKTATDDVIQRAVSSFAWKDVADKYEQTYREVLGLTRRRIGRVHVDVHSYQSATDFIAQAAKGRESRLVTFANAHSVNVAAKYPEMEKALEKATVLNDGVGVDMASRFLYGEAFPENLNGTDFVPHLLAAPGLDLAVFVLGSTPEVARKAADHIEHSFPSVRVVGYHHGFFGADDDTRIRDLIEASGANLVLVGMGQPRQEIWAARYLDGVPAVTICVGALLDFMVGRVKRAPVGWRRRKMEWLYRLFQEPRRLTGRYVIGNVMFVGRILYQRISGYRV